MKLMSAKWNLLGVAVFLTCSRSLWAFDCTNAPSGLVSWWAAEGEARDVASLNAGVISNGVGFSMGWVGQAFSFNGTNGYLRIPSSANLNVGAGDGFSIEMWVNPSDITRPQPLLQWNDQFLAAPYYGVSLWISVPPANRGTGPGCLLLDVKDNRSVKHNPVCSTGGLITSNAWQHVAATYSKASGVATLYLNGAVLVQTNVGIIATATDQDLWLGYERNQFETDLFSSIGPVARYAGGMDEVSIYSRVLLPAEIAAVYSAGANGKCPRAPTVIAIQPPSLSVAEGGSGSYAALASGSSPLSYQWRFMGTNLAGETRSSLVLTNVQLTDAGNYAVAVANSIDSLLSPTAVLTVLPAYAPTWARTSAPSNTWTSVACSADGMKLVAATYGGAIYTSPDFGATWWSNNVPKLTWNSVASSADGTKLVAAAITLALVGAPDGAIYGSTNSGATWNLYTSGSSSEVVCSEDGARLAAILHPYIYTSADFGASWTKSAAPFASWHSLACSADGQKLMAANRYTYAIHRSSNFGGSWYPTSAPTTNLWQSITSSTDGNKLAAAVLHDTSPTSAGGSVFVSTDSGNSWTRSGAPTKNWIDIAASADGTKLVGAEYSIYSSSPFYTLGYLYISTDGGATWVVTRSPMENWRSVASSDDGTKLVAASLGYIYVWEPTALNLSLANGNVVISWPTNVPGFILQRNIDLSANEWINVTNVPAVLNSKYEVVLPQSTSGQIFRLMYP